MSLQLTTAYSRSFDSSHVGNQTCQKCNRSTNSQIVMTPSNCTLPVFDHIWDRFTWDMKNLGIDRSCGLRDHNSIQVSDGLDLAPCQPRCSVPTQNDQKPDQVFT